MAWCWNVESSSCLFYLGQGVSKSLLRLYLKQTERGQINSNQKTKKTKQEVHDGKNQGKLYVWFYITSHQDHA